MPETFKLPVYEEELLGGLYALGDHEFRIPPTRGDVVQTWVEQEEQYVVFEVVRIEHRTTESLGIDERLMLPVVVVTRKAPATPE